VLHLLILCVAALLTLCLCRCLLAAVAASLGAFPWPVYQCVLPLLEAVAQEGVRRQAAGEMSPAASSALVATALGSAAALNLRFGAELEAKVAGWQNQARLATGGNILGFASAGASTAEEPAYSR
jgi:O-antigen/teichoic acid export membrane protein